MFDDLKNLLNEKGCIFSIKEENFIDENDNRVVLQYIPILIVEKYKLSFKEDQPATGAAIILLKGADDSYIFHNRCWLPNPPEKISGKELNKPSHNLNYKQFKHAEVLYHPYSIATSNFKNKEEIIALLKGLRKHQILS